MGFFDDAKKIVSEHSVLDKIKALGVDTSGLSAYKDGAITYISGTVDSEDDVEKIKAEFGGFISGSTTKIDIDADKQYTIVDGDSPWGVAQKFYGDGSKFPILIEMNDGKDTYYTGEEILIPSLRSYVGGMKLQVMLSALGYNPGPIDGVVGGKSITALKEFQRNNDLSADGELDKNTRNALRAAFRNVDKLEGLALQFVLKDIGYKIGNLDGVVGSQTVAALKQFQNDNGLDESGSADDATVTALASKFV